MSTSPADGRQTPARKSPWTPRRIALGAVLAYAVLLALFNLDSVAVNFVFFKTEASLFVVIVLAVAPGFAMLLIGRERGAGFALVMALLGITLPLIGHATWHAYRALVEPAAG